MKKVFFVLLVCLVAYGCKKDDRLIYDSQDNVYLDNNETDTAMRYSFAVHEPAESHTLMIPVKLSGKRIKQDRSFVISVVDTGTNATSGLHFEPLKSLYVMPADSGMVHVPIIIRNVDPELASKTVTLMLRISGGADFGTSLPVAMRTRKIIFSNRLEKPIWWSDWEAELGPYSRTKHMLFLVASGTVDLPLKSAPNSFMLFPRALYYIENTRVFLTYPVQWVEENPSKGYVLTKRSDGTGDYDFYNVSTPGSKYHLKYVASVNRYVFIDENGEQISQ